MSQAVACEPALRRRVNPRSEAVCGGSGTPSSEWNGGCVDSRALVRPFGAGHLIARGPIGDRHDYACMRAGLISYAADLLAVRSIAQRRGIANTRRSPHEITKLTQGRRLVARF